MWRIVSCVRAYRFDGWMISSDYELDRRKDRIHHVILKAFYCKLALRNSSTKLRYMVIDNNLGVRGDRFDGGNTKRIGWPHFSGARASKLKWFLCKGL